MCKQKFHSLLHRTTSTNSKQNSSNNQCSTSTFTSNPYPNFIRPTNSSSDEMPSTSAATQNQVHHSYSTNLQSTSYTSIILGTALVDVCVGDVRCTVRALIDPASEASFISKPLQMKLSLPSRSSKTDVIGLNGSFTATSSQTCSIVIGSPLDRLFFAKADVFVVRKLTDLKMADIDLHKGSHVDLLLGGDIYPKILCQGVKWGNDQSLVAQQTVFGWIVTGRVAPFLRYQPVSSFFNEIDLNRQITRFWELEEVPETTRMSEDDIYCEHLHTSTTYRNDVGRFVVSLPFRREFPINTTLGHSRSNALAQYLRNEARLAKQPTQKSEYDRVILEHLTI